MPITRECDKCGKKREHPPSEYEKYFNAQKIGEKWHVLCEACLKSHNQLVKAITKKHQEEKQKSLELWLNNKHG